MNPPLKRPEFGIRKSRRDLLKPDCTLESFLDITPNFLLERHLRGLLLDLDNTLIPYASREDAPEVVAWVGGLLEQGVQLYLLSNATHGRVAFWVEKLQFTGVGLASKPFPRAFEKAIRGMQLEPRQVAMVGDQLFTDVLGGNLAGAYTILVKPLSDNALPHTRIIRRLERSVMKRYARRSSSQKL